MANHNEIGEKGEALAKSFLEKKGYKILATNYRFKKLEIDIVSEFKGKLVVAEVKTRQSSYLAGPEDTVSKSKQRGIVKCANAYIIENEIDMETRFDIISIILNQNEKSIDHLEDAFYPLL
ncbi:MAG: YraN family protein [Crocinitomicaceae bacterium]